MPNTTVPAAATGLPEILRDPQAPNGAMTFTIDMAALRRMDMKELGNFRDATHTAAEILCGLVSQPRFGDEEARDGMNEAGRLLDDFIDFLNGYEQAAVNVARAARPESATEIERRAWTLIGFEADMIDELAPLAVLAAVAVRDVAVASRERRAA